MLLQLSFELNNQVNLGACNRTSELFGTIQRKAARELVREILGVIVGQLH